MNPQESMADLHRRLDDFEKRLAEAEAEIGRTGAVPPHYRERIDEIFAQSKATRRKLLRSDESTWDMVKDEFESDWEALKANFDFWVTNLDEEYRRRGS